MYIGLILLSGCSFQMVYNVRSNLRGRVIIFSWRYFLCPKLTGRKGNEQDVENLEKLFKQHLQFEVEVFHNLDKQVSDLRFDHLTSSRSSIVCACCYICVCNFYDFYSVQKHTDSAHPYTNNSHMVRAGGCEVNYLVKGLGKIFQQFLIAGIDRHSRLAAIRWSFSSLV